MPAWNETKEGKQVNDAWDQLTKAYALTIPNDIQSLRDLAGRQLAPVPALK